MDNYYDLFDVANNYKRILYRAGKGLQSRELNEQQLILGNEIATLAKAIHTEGSLLKGGENTFIGNVLTIAGSIFFARGYTHIVPSASFTIASLETDSVGILIIESIITELEEPNLRDPAVGTKNFNLPGGHRLRMDARWVKGSSVSPNDRSNYYPIHQFEDGVLSTPRVEAPEISGIESRLASYDYNANGSYIVHGFVPNHLSDDMVTDEHILSISEGAAHVEGYAIEYAFAQRLRAPFAKNTMAVNNEPINFTGDGWYPLRWSPLAAVGEVNGQKRVTRTITHGNYTGVRDLLPETPVVEIESVTQGATTYNSGSDYLHSGDYIDWSPSGAEPAPGTTYTVVFVYQATQAAPISSDRTKVRLEGFKANTSVLVDYTFYIPRIDRLVLLRSGDFKLLQGAPHPTSPVAPETSTGLPLATIRLAYGTVPQITQDSYRAFQMQDVQAMLQRIERQEYQIAQLVLRDSARDSDPTTVKRNLFTDPFLGVATRDPGMYQTADSTYGVLEPWVFSTDLLVCSRDTPIMLPFTEVVDIKQDGYSGDRRVNEFETAEVPPGIAQVKPNTMTWTAEETTVNVDGGERVKTVWNAGVNTTKWSSETTTSSKITNAVNAADYRIPEGTIVHVTGGKFNGNEEVQVMFDGALVATVRANGQGEVATDIRLPAGIPAGSKSVLLSGVESTVAAHSVFTATPQIKTVTNTVTRIRTNYYWGDPVAETFTAEATGRLASVDLQFSTATTGFVDVLITETLNGYPNTDRTIYFVRVPGNQLKVNQWTNIKFPIPVPVEAGEEYALVLITADTNLRVRTAVLGQWDLANQKHMTRQNYLKGTMFNSANGRAWSALQNEDIMFRLNRAKFTVNTKVEDILGTVSVTDATDLMLLANMELAPGTGAGFILTLLDRNNEELSVVPHSPVRLASYTGRVKVAVTMSTENDRVSPVISADVFLANGTVELPSTYVNAQFAFSGSKIKSILDVFEPSGSLIKLYHRTNEVSLVPGNGTGWAASSTFGAFYYTGSALTGARVAALIKAGTNLFQVPEATMLMNDTFFWGDLDAIGSPRAYVKETAISLDAQWQAGSVANEFYYAASDMAKPAAVKVGNTTLTSGTPGSLSQGQFGFGPVAGKSGNYIYVRMPSAEVVGGKTNPNDYPNGFTKYVVSPADKPSGYVQGSSWVEVPRKSASPIGNGYVEVLFESEDVTGLSRTQLLIEGSTNDTTRRPLAKNLRAFVV